MTIGMTTAVQRQWHAVDAPFADPDEWGAQLLRGNCTACGMDASQGRLRWWHDNQLLCPVRHQRVPSFAADETTPSSRRPSWLR